MMVPITKMANLVKIKITHTNRIKTDIKVVRLPLMMLIPISFNDSRIRPSLSFYFD